MFSVSSFAAVSPSPCAIYQTVSSSRRAQEFVTFFLQPVTSPKRRERERVATRSPSCPLVTRVISRFTTVERIKTRASAYITQTTPIKSKQSIPRANHWSSHPTLPIRILCTKLYGNRRPPRRLAPLPYRHPNARHFTRLKYTSLKPASLCSRFLSDPQTKKSSPAEISDIVREPVNPRFAILTARLRRRKFRKFRGVIVPREYWISGGAG